jgi:hypothetical protein
MKFEDSDEFDVETIIAALCAQLRRTTADKNYLQSQQSKIDWDKLKTSSLFTGEKARQMPKRARDGKFLPRIRK